MLEIRRLEYRRFDPGKVNALQADAAVRQSGQFGGYIDQGDFPTFGQTANNGVVRRDVFTAICKKPHWSLRVFVSEKGR